MKSVGVCLKLFAVTAAVMACTSCYNIGYLGHPQIRTIAIAPVSNQTTAYNAAADLRNLLNEQFMIDGTYKVKSQSEADCIVYADIIDFTTTKVADTTDDDEVIYRVIEWQATVTVEFTVIIPGRKEPLIKPRKVTGSILFQSSGDMETSRRNGQKMASRKAAQDIVTYTTEAW